MPKEMNGEEALFCGERMSGPGTRAPLSYSLFSMFASIRSVCSHVR